MFERSVEKESRLKCGMDARQNSRERKEILLGRTESLRALHDALTSRLRGCNN